MNRSLVFQLILLGVLAAISTPGCSTKGPENSNNQASTNVPPSNIGPGNTSLAPPSPENVRKSIEQITAIIDNTKRWKAQGHSYGELNPQRAVSDGVIPKDMIQSDGGIVNPWGGAASLGPNPEGANSFYILFSAVPAADCVQLALQGKNSFEVRAGNWGGAAANEAEAKGNCVTGNI